MVKRWEDDQEAVVALTDQDSKMAKVIHESGWNARYEYDANHTERRWTAIAKNFHMRATAAIRAGEAILGLVQSPPLSAHRP
jgi:YD repeat-containing protein